MHHYSLLQLREMADSLAVMAQILETNPFYLRSTQIRQVDKTLRLLEVLTPIEVVNEAKIWKESNKALNILKNKLDTVDDTQKRIEEIEENIIDAKTKVREWYLLDEEERALITQYAKRSEDFLTKQGDIREADVIARYHRSLELKNLFVYADRAPYLCDALYHHTQEAHYKQNIEKLDLRIKSVHTRIKSINNGLWIALALCALVATIPICLPFSLSLWGRKQKLKSHLIIYEDLQEREEKRLELGKDGEKIIKEIQDLRGDLSIDSIKDLLIESKDLKAEFHNSEKFLSICAMILSFIDSNQDLLVKVFGEIPTNPQNRFAWLSEKVRCSEDNYNELASLQLLKQDFSLKKKQATKGYKRSILLEGITELKSSMENIFNNPLSFEHKLSLSEVCIQLPEMTKKIREIIYSISQGHEIDVDVWNNLKSCLQQYSYDLALYVLDAEISITTHKKDHDGMEKVSSSLQTDMINEEVII